MNLSSQPTIQNFTFLNGTQPPRWFQPDNGQSVVFKVNTSGAPNSQIMDDINSAMSAWSNVSNSALRVTNGGSTGGCRNGSTNNAESPAITPDEALRQIATVPSNYLTTPSASQLQTIYATIAQDLSKGSSSLVDETVH